MTTHANARGNTIDRRRRQQWLLSHFGNGTTAPCWQCGKRVSGKTMCVDRKRAGGSYRRSNIRIHCPKCSTQQGYRLGAGNAASSTVRASHPANVRRGGVPGPKPKRVRVLREILIGIALGIAILFILAMVNSHAGLAISVATGIVFGSILDATQPKGIFNRRNN